MPHPAISYQQLAISRGFSSENEMLRHYFTHYQTVHGVYKALDCQIPYANLHKRYVDLRLIKPKPRSK